MVIALVDPFSKGHHETYMKLFAATLLKQNHQVVILCPQPQIIYNYIVEQFPEKKNEIYVNQFSDVSLSVKLHPLFYHYILTIKRWLLVKKTIKNTEQMHQIKVDFVFFNWLDSFLFKYVPTWLINNLFPFKWSGLYFHANHIRKEKYGIDAKANLFTIDNVLQSKNCNAVATLDRFIVPQLGLRTQKQVVVFPDITNINYNDVNKGAVATQIAEKSNGRAVVGIIGIEKRKNILNLIRTALIADNQQFFFVFIGKIKFDEFSEPEQTEIRKFLNNLPENCFYSDAYLKDGDEFNGVFNLFTIPWVVYTNFYSASNILVKAAYFKKLVIGSNKHCIADSIITYKLGYTVNEQDVNDIYQKLQLLSNANNALTLLSPNFDEFYNLNSEESLNKSFLQLLNE